MIRIRPCKVKMILKTSQNVSYCVYILYNKYLYFIYGDKTFSIIEIYGDCMVKLQLFSTNKSNNRVMET